MVEPISTVKGVIQVGLEIREICRTVKANKKQCAILGERIEIIMELIKGIPQDQLCIPAQTAALDQLRIVLEGALDLISTFLDSGNDGFASRLWRCKGYSKKFKQVLERLEECLSDLAIGCAFDADAHHKAVKEDHEETIQLLEKEIGKLDTSLALPDQALDPRLVEMHAIMMKFQALDLHYQYPSSPVEPSIKKDVWFAEDKDVQVIGEQGKYGPKPIGQGAFAQVFKAKYCGEVLAKKELREALFQVNLSGFFYLFMC
jgi:hypothetical protein